MARIIFSAAKRKCTFALGLLGIFLIVQFVLIAISTSAGEDAVSIMDAARLREYLVAKSLTTVYSANNSAGMNSVEELSLQITELSQLYDQLGSTRNLLYFASSSSAFGQAPSLTSAQQTITFGGTNSLDLQYLQWRLWVQTIATLVPSAVVNANASSPLAATFAVSDSVKQTLTTTLGSMRAAYPALASILQQSSTQYESDLSGAVSAGTTPDIILTIAVCVLIIIELRFVFYSISQTLDDEELGTRLTLNMIPPNVRELVPKIPLYLETGVLVEETDEQKVYSRTPHFTEFVSAWTKDAGEDQCFAVLDKCTTHGFMVINAAGIVQYAHANITKYLGYDDLVGKNINILLEEPLKSLHDGFLRRFVQQGTSRIVGMGRDVVALSKSGVRTHLYLFLEAAVRSNGEVYFVGQLEPYDFDKCRGDDE